MEAWIRMIVGLSFHNLIRPRGWKIMGVAESGEYQTLATVWSNVIDDASLLADLVPEDGFLEEIRRGWSYDFAFLRAYAESQPWVIVKTPSAISMPVVKDTVWSLVSPGAEHVAHVCFLNAPYLGGFEEITGTSFSATPKLPKRLNEVSRESRYYRKFEGDDLLKIDVFEVPDHLVKYYDGISVITPSALARLARNRRDRRYLEKHAKNGGFRLLTSDGLIKGDFIVARNDEALGGWDVVTSADNLKKEFRIDEPGTQLCQVFLHHDHHEAYTDDQTLSWMGEAAFPVEQMEATMEHKVNEVLADLEAGEFPSYMVIDDSEEETLVDDLKATYHKWQAAGGSLRNWAYFIFMIAGAFMNKMRKGMRFPIPWATYTHVVTHQVLTLAGYGKVVEEMGDRVFYHEATGRFSMPGHKVEELFENHGGFDLDDSFRILLRRFADDGIKAMLVRSPNNFGEYSIVDVDADSFLPVMYNTEDSIPEMDKTVAEFIAKLPTIHEVNKVATCKELTPAPSLKNSRWDVGLINKFIKTNKASPGVGAWANVMMVLCDTLRRCTPSQPYRRVYVATEDVVDALMQGGTAQQFMEIQDDIEDSLRIVGNFVYVDRYFLYGKGRRISQETAENFGILPLPKDQPGYMSQLLAVHNRTLKSFHDRAVALSGAQRIPIPELLEIPTTDGDMKWATAAVRSFTSQSRQLAKGIATEVLVDNGDGTKTLRNIIPVSEARRQLVARVVDKINSQSPELQVRMIAALYKVTEKKRVEFGDANIGDVILCHQGVEDDETVLDKVIAILA